MRRMQEVQRTAEAPVGDRFGRLVERADGADFPYYNGVPVGLSGAQWGLVLGAVALGFGLLTAAPLGRVLAGFPPALLFAGVPLAGLALVARGHWTALFRRVTARDVLTMAGFAGLNIVISFAVGLAVSMTVGGAAANPEARDRTGLARQRPAVRPGPPAHLRLERRPVRRHHRLGAPGLEPGVSPDEEPVGEHRRARPERLGPPLPAPAHRARGRLTRRRPRRGRTPHPERV